MRILVALALIIFSASVGVAEDIGFLKGATCGLEVRDQLLKWEVAKDWTRQVDPEQGMKSYRTHTAKFAVWVEIHIAKDSSATAFRLSPKGVETAVWSHSESCAPKISLDTKSAILPAEENGNKYFTDTDLATLLRKNQKGMIYVWSPNMTYSMEYFDHARDVAKKLGLPLTVLMDPRVAESEVALAKNFKMPIYERRVESIELLMRDVGVHYPDTLVYRNGKLSYHVIIGVLDTGSLEKAVNADLGSN